MGSPYKPTIASSNTGKPILQGNKMLPAVAPMTGYGTANAPSGHIHNNVGPAAFNTPTHGAGLIGNSGQHVQNKEMRNPKNGIAHISMKPGAM